jgi:hypothetical protein
LYHKPKAILKKQRNKRHEVKKIKMEMSKRKNTYKFLILDSQPFPIPARRNARG